jgi:hypothetical protein
VADAKKARAKDADDEQKPAKRTAARGKAKDEEQEEEPARARRRKSA